MTEFVTIVNQTGRQLTLNLSPVSDNSLYLPPRGRQNILQEEIEAVEIQGALNAVPPRLALIWPKKKVAPEAKTIVVSKPALPKTEPMSEVQGASSEPSSDEETQPKPRLSRRRSTSSSSL